MVFLEWYLPGFLAAMLFLWIVCWGAETDFGYSKSETSFFYTNYSMIIGFFVLGLLGWIMVISFILLSILSTLAWFFQSDTTVKLREFLNTPFIGG